MNLKSYQKINHFSGMLNLCRKNFMAINLNRLKEYFPEEYNFYPKTWILPNDWNNFSKLFDSGSSKRVIICKPDAGCQGRGIILTRTLDRINPADKQVAQIYEEKPLLIDGYKVKDNSK